jgi:DNA-binding transcriptional LysR family regulator
MQVVAELRHYRYFVEIARRGSFTAASSSLHVTQSALSEQIMDLERELGCKLFDRGRHGARLTSNGEHLLGQAEQLLRNATEIERTARSRLMTKREAFRIAVTMSPLLMWLPEALADLRQRHRSVDVYLEDAPTAEIFLRVTSGKVDLGIVSLGPLAHLDFVGSGLATEVLIEDDWVLLVPVGHRFCAEKVVPLAELRGEPLIMFPRNFSLRTVVDELLEQAGVAIAPVIETGWMEMAIRFVSVGLGVCVAPRAVTLLQHPGVEVIELAGRRNPRRALTAIYRADSPRLKLTERVLAMAREHLDPLRAQAGWDEKLLGSLAANAS